MIDTSGSSGWVTRGALVIAAAAAVGVASPVAAVAHTELLGSQPASGQVSATGVDRIRLEFATPVLREFTQVTVTGGSPVSVAEPLVSGGVVEAPVSGLHSAGEYVVSYRTVAADGHPVTGSFAFEIEADRAEAALGAAAPSGAAGENARGTSVLAATAVGTAVVVIGVGALQRRRGRGRQAWSS
jgi:methionine-rich copper-binding protein CopC